MRAGSQIPSRPARCRLDSGRGVIFVRQAPSPTVRRSAAAAARSHPARAPTRQPRRAPLRQSRRAGGPRPGARTFRETTGSSTRLNQWDSRRVERQGVWATAAQVVCAAMFVVVLAVCVRRYTRCGVAVCRFGKVQEISAAQWDEPAIAAQPFRRRVPEFLVAAGACARPTDQRRHPSVPGPARWPAG